VLVAEAGVRIALIAPLVTAVAEPQVGGSQALLADVAAGLAGRGHDVRVFAASGSKIEGVTVVDTGVDPAGLAGSLFRPGASTTSYHGPAGAVHEAFERAVAMVGEWSPDAVHVHAFDAPAVDAAGALPCPVIQVLHLPPTGDISDALRAARSRPRPPVVVTVSEWMRTAWIAAGVPSVVIRNGVPIDRIRWDPRPGTGELLFAGRLSPEKGALEALEIARRAGLGIRLLGPPYEAGYADRVARASGAVPGASVEGPATRPRLWRLMAKARAVLCPALWDEPFGMVAAEAQAAGTPVIGFRRGALPEVVDDGVTGALVPEGDLDAAAAAAAEADRRFDRSACRRHAERSLDVRATIEGYEAVSEQAVRDAAARGAVRADR
jgi:UDP-glucose:tetrahydrobiopterin glucosyltransferase